MFNAKYYVDNDLAISAEKCEKSIIPFVDPIETDVYDNAIILPLRWSHKLSEPSTVRDVYEGGVCSSDFTFLAGFHLKRNAIKPSNLECTECYVPDNIENCDETIIYGGYLTRSFGLTITDGVTRLWYALREKKHKIAFVLRDEIDPYSAFHCALFELAGIPKNRIAIIDTPTRFRQVIVPRQSAYWLDTYNKEFFEVLYNKIRETAKPARSKRIYLSRAKYATQDLFNESYFEDYFSSNGYDIIYPEQLPIDQQISYIAGAEEIACTYGTLSHLSLFAQPGIKCIFLLRSANLTADFIRQHIINNAKNLDFVFIDVSLNLLPTYHDAYSGYIIGPSCSWTDFLKNEYGIETNVDIFDYLNKANIKLGDYIKHYLYKTKSRRNFVGTFGYRFNHIAYLKSLYNSFYKSGYSEMLTTMKINENPDFINKMFQCREIVSNQTCTIKLCQDGSLTAVRGNMFQECKYWSYFNLRLFFLNQKYEPVIEFSTRDYEEKTLLGRYRIYLGRSITSKSFANYKLSTKNNVIIKFIIKLLVNKKMYKKFKKDPVLFFDDSKSNIIKSIGKFYL